MPQAVTASLMHQRGRRANTQGLCWDSHPAQPAATRLYNLLDLVEVVFARPPVVVAVLICATPGHCPPLRVYVMRYAAGIPCI